MLATGASRRDLETRLQAAGIVTGAHYPFVIPDQKALSGRAFVVAGELANARRIASSEVSLPLHPYLSEEEARQVVTETNK